MADVKVIDIDNEQWNIKDQTAREKIANIEKDIVTKDLQNVIIELAPGYTASTALCTYHYSVGKIHFMTIRLVNLEGINIGSGETATIGSINIHPIKTTNFILYDYKNYAIVRCYLLRDGTFLIGESVGVIKNNNSIIGELIFAEP